MRLGIIGLDEIALKKGHRDFVTIVTARLEDGNVELLAVLSDRKKESVLAFLRSIPVALRVTMHSACIDMNEGYAAALREVLPYVKIIVDRFHVARTYRDAADTLRKREQRRLEDELTEQEYKKLHGAMWAFRKRPENLDEDERAVLKRLFAHSADLERAYELREDLTILFDLVRDKPTAKAALGRWQCRVQRSGLSCFDRLITTLSNWTEEITNYFHERESSGYIEGLKNKIKLLKRRCYGIFQIPQLFRRIFPDLKGYELFAT